MEVGGERVGERRGVLLKVDPTQQGPTGVYSPLSQGGKIRGRTNTLLRGFSIFGTAAS